MLKYCSIGSGSSGNCHYIGYKDTNILVDAGLSGKRITTGLDDINVDMENIKGIFITHEHSDHIKGAGIISRKYDIPIFANVKTWCAMKDKLGDIKDSNMKVFENDRSYSLGDIGMITDNIRRHLYKSKLVVLESNYDPNMLMMGSYPYSLKKRVMSDTGHLSNEDAAKFCIDLVKEGTERILLAHLSKENNFPELAYETSKSILAQNDIIIGQDLKLDVLLREEVSDIYNVK